MLGFVVSGKDVGVDNKLLVVIEVVVIVVVIVNMVVIMDVL